MPCFVAALQVKLYKSDNLDNPIQTVSLGQSLFFHFPPLLRDGQVSPLLSTLSLLERLPFSAEGTQFSHFFPSCHLADTVETEEVGLSRDFFPRISSFSVIKIIHIHHGRRSGKGMEIRHNTVIQKQLLLTR